MKIQAYHGTNSNFSKFDFDKIGKVNGTDSGFGFYFTTNKGEAVMYGNIVMTVNLNLKKSISNYKITLSDIVIKNLLNLLKKYGYDFTENFNYDMKDSVEALRDYNDTDTELIGDLINSLTGGKPEIVLKCLSKLGYNYTTEEKRLVDAPNTEHYVMFDNKDIIIEKKQKI